MLGRKLQSAAVAGPEGAWDLSYAYYDDPRAWDMSTVSSTRSASVTDPEGVYVSPDGLNFYIAVGGSSSAVTQYSASTPWNVTTLSFVRTRSLTAQDSATKGVFFKPDGTKMYTVGIGNDDVYEYSLSTPWNISTTSFVTSINSQSDPYGLYFSPDGTRMYVCGTVSDRVDQYSLSTAWSLATATFVQSKSVSAQDAQPVGVSFKPDGTKMILTGAGNSRAYTYDLATPWDISTATYASFVSLSGTTVRGGFIRQDGGMYFHLSVNGDSIYSASLGGYNVSSLTGPSDLFIKSDGAQAYVLSAGANDRVYPYTLVSPWDFSAVNAGTSFDVAAQDQSPLGLFFKPDGTKMYVVGAQNDNVYEYSLSTPWTVSTASYVQSFSISGQETNPQALFFKNDGTKMYVLGADGDDVNEYSLSTAWDISTASYAQNFSIAAQETGPVGLFFKDGGTKMYVLGDAGDDVNEYSLSAAWDISTAAYVQNFSVASHGATTNGLFFKDDGTKMYVLQGATASTQRIFTYSIGVQP